MVSSSRPTGASPVRRRSARSRPRRRAHRAHPSGSASRIARCRTGCGDRRWSAPSRRRAGRRLAFGTRSGCVGLPLQAQTARTATRKTHACENSTIFGLHRAGLQAWDVDRLIALSKDLPRRQVNVEELGEFDRPWTGDGEDQTWRDARRTYPLDQRRPTCRFRSSWPRTARSWTAAIASRKPRSKDARRSAPCSLTDDPPPDHVGPQSGRSAVLRVSIRG